MKNIGKRFEEDISKSIPGYVMSVRLKDSSLNYNRTEKSSYSTNNPYDFLVWDSKHKIIYTLELKTVKGKSISFERIKDDKGEIHNHQIEGLRYAATLIGIINKKSFNLNDLDNNNIKYTIIEQHIKRTRYSYDMDAFFSGKEEHNED